MTFWVSDFLTFLFLIDLSRQHISKGTFSSGQSKLQGEIFAIHDITKKVEKAYDMPTPEFPSHERFIELNDPSKKHLDNLKNISDLL